MSQDRTLRKEEAPRETRAGEGPREPRIRKRKGDTDPFHIADGIIPEGMTYEWKRKSTYGKEDVTHQLHMAENGWEPVMAERHKGYMPTGYAGAIERDGMVLMERPVELTREARAEERGAALANVRDNQRQFGETPDDTLPRKGASIKRSFTPREIPEE